VPTLDRAEKAEPYHDELVRLVHDCKGQLVRVHEELVAQGAALSYPALTAYCRRHGIGHEPKQPAGRYDHQPGKEMQHDTSPHSAHVGGRERSVQLAGLALANALANVRRSTRPVPESILRLNPSQSRPTPAHDG